MEIPLRQSRRAIIAIDGNDWRIKELVMRVKNRNIARTAIWVAHLSLWALCTPAQNMTVECIATSPFLAKFRSTKLVKLAQMANWARSAFLATIPEDHMLDIKATSDQDHSDWQLQDINSLPEWMVHNKYLLTSHRPPLPSVKACLLSAFRLHTETGNIWSHAIGGVFMLILAIQVMLHSQYSTIDQADQLIYGIFFAGVVTCLIFSATYHTLCCHSEPVELWFLRLDFIGIILVIVSHNIPYLYYGFYCQPIVRSVYIAVNILLAISVIVILSVEECGQAKYRVFRAVVFSAFASFGIVPMTHFVTQYNDLLANQPEVRYGALCLLVTVGLYYLGVLLHATQTPEKYFPGKCDIWFHSHQLFHILVVLAMLVHYHGFTRLSEYVRSLPPDHCQLNL